MAAWAAPAALDLGFAGRGEGWLFWAADMVDLEDWPTIEGNWGAHLVRSYNALAGCW